MKFKISLPKRSSHGDVVTCVGWASTEEVFSAGDDHQLLAWNVSTGECSKVCDLGDGFFPTDLQFLPRPGGSLGKHGDLVLLAAADGKFHVLGAGGRKERTVEAHKGAVLVGRWGHDGASLLTGGEDGVVKVWSRSGMLRSTVVVSDNPIYGACWSPDSQAIAYTQGRMVVIKQLAPNTKPLQWRAHEGAVICLAWSPVNDLLVSGGEDCRYRVWDSRGRQIFSSSVHESPISAVAWSPSGDLFAVGAYNTLRLCDYSGWSRSLEKPDTGCIYKISWSSDGTQAAGACADGRVIFANVIERRVHYQNFCATITDRKGVTVRDVSNDTEEYLELPERVIQMAMRYQHLVVTTPNQCYIYNTSNWNTPIIFDLKEGSVNLLMMSEKHLLLVEKSLVSLYNYQGRLVASPRWSNMKADVIRQSFVSISNDTLVARDASDEKTLHVVDLSSSRSAGDSVINIQHNMAITHVALNQSGLSSARMAAIVDKARDLYVVSVYSPHKTFLKLASQIHSFKWNSEENLIAAIQDTRLVVWYCPTAAFSASLLRMASFYYDSPELGKSPRIDDFVGDSVSVRRADGSLLNIMTSPFPSLLHKYIQENKWTDALNLCRGADDNVLWVCLAVLSVHSGADHLDIAEEAFAAINHYDKVLYLQHLKSLTSRALQTAGAALLGGSLVNAETILLHNGMVYPAISINMQMHNWTRALEIAQKHKVHIDTVLYKRKLYLQTLDKEESNKKFLALKDVAIDEEAIEKKIHNEIQKYGDL